MRKWLFAFLLLSLLLADAISNVVNVGFPSIVGSPIIGDYNIVQQNTASKLIQKASAQFVNEPPIADAGSDQIVGEGDTVSLSAADSFDPDSTESLIFSWQQISGTPAISLAGSDTATPSFIAPNVASSSDTLVFQVTVTDSEEETSMDEVQIVVNNIAGYHSPNYSPSFPATGSSYYDIPDSSSLQIDSTFAAATWFKTSSFYTGNVMIVNKGGFGSDSAGENMNYGIWMNSAEKIIAGFETSAGVDKYVRSSIEYNNGKWHYAVVTFNDSIIRLYIDGAEVDSLNTSTSPDSGSTDPLRIGANSRGTNNYFKGEIDEVRVWDRVVTASEVSDQYSLGKFDTQRQLVYMNGASHTGTPIANAGADQTVDERATVILDGTGSSDPDNEQLTYYWKQTAGPTVSLQDAYSATPSFEAPDVGSGSTSLTFELMVTDEIGAAANDSIDIEVIDSNQNPIGDAGPDQTVNEGDSVLLDGTNSSDPDGDSLSYSWMQLDGPIVSLSDPNVATPTFLAPEVYDSDGLKITFDLAVNDGISSSTDTIGVTINNTPGYNNIYTPSFAASGSNYFDIPDHPSLRLQEFTAAAWFKTSSFYSGNAMIVNKGGFGSESPGQNMNYGIWFNSNERLVVGFETSTGTDVFIVKTSPLYNDGIWHYAVVTYDGSNMILYVDGVQVATRSATATPDIDGSQPLRIGANSNPSGNINYFIGEIDEVRVWNRAVTTDEVSQQYDFGLFSINGLLLYMDGTHANSSPIADAGSDQLVNEGTSVTLDGTSSSDPDGDSLSYSWKLTGGPTIVELSRANTANPTFIAPEVNDINATFSFELTVDDSYGGISTDTVNVIVQNTGFPDFNFAAVGDFGCTENTEAVVAAIARANPELVMGLGDYSYDKLPDCWYGTIGPIEDKMHYPTTIALGNHENAENKAARLSEAGRADFLNHFDLTEDTTFYSFDYQNVHFLVLDTEKPYKDGTAQYKFAKNDLLQARLNHDIDWIVAYFHSNIYGYSQAHPPFMEFRNTYQPLFDAYNVDLVLQGHVHNYQRTKPLEYNHTSTSNKLTSYSDPHGQIYVIAGMGGQSLTGSTSRASYILVKDTTNYGFMDIAMINNGSMMVVRFYNTTDHVLDEFTITKDITNTPPIADAGTNKGVNERSTVMLDGSASFDPDSSDSLTYKWKQTDNTGYTVTLSPDSTSPFVSFTAPDVPYGASVILLFKLIVFDKDNARSSHTVSVTVNNIDPLGYAYDPYFVATGTDSYSIPDTLSLRPSIFTVTAWFKTDSSFSGNAVIVNKGGFGTDSIGQNLNYGIWMDKNERVVGGFELADGTDKFIVSPNAYNDNQWHYVSLTYDGGTIRLYIDNIEVANMASTKDPDTASSSSLKIGANARMDNLYFIGDIDEMRLWNRALSAGELAAQYDNGLFDTSGQLVYFDGISHITS